MNRIAAIPVAFALIGVAIARVPNAATGFAAVLKSKRPDVQWDVSSLVVGDIDGDMKQDFAAVGYQSKEVVLAIQASTAADKLNFLNFGVNPGDDKDAMCSLPVRLSTAPLSCNSGAGHLQGCKGNTGTLALILNDGVCDAMNLYWNHDLDRLAWWRK
jgi:hypothetical protein